jgi:hypothetical protein
MGVASNEWERPQNFPAKIPKTLDGYPPNFEKADLTIKVEVIPPHLNPRGNDSWFGNHDPRLAVANRKRPIVRKEVC